MITQQSFPQTSSPLVDIKTGKITQIWLQLFISLFTRTGQSQGNSLDDPTIIAIMSNEGISTSSGSGHVIGPISTITVNPSPFVYTATTSGSVWISPGTYADIQLTRGITSLSFGFITRGVFPMAPGDNLTVTYTTLTPVMYFIPS